MTAFLTWPFAATGGTATRTLPNRLADVVNVLEFTGVDPTGVSDSTAGIQAAFDAAYGSQSSPHGTNYYTNKSVFFPPGHYKVSAPSAKTVSAAVNDGTGKIKLTVSDTVGLTTGDVCSLVGTVGLLNSLDPPVYNANRKWVITVIDATHVTLQNSGFGGTYISGGQLISSALKLSSVVGAHIYGSGRFTTTIECGTPSSILLGTDCFEYSIIEGIQFKVTGSGGPIVLDLDRVTTSYLTVQSNTVRDCYFQGTYNTSDGSCGIRVGYTVLSQGSENLFQQCYITGFQNGVYIGNANALANTFILGNISGCDIGINIFSGSCQIYSTAFQANASWDIKQLSDANDTMSVIGARSESTNFLISGGTSVTLQNISHLSPNGNGTFADVGTSPSFRIDNCTSYAGTILASDGGGDCRGIISGGQYKRADWLYSNITGSTGEIQIFNVRYKGTRDTSTSGGPLFISAQQITSAGTKNFTIA